MSYPRTQARTHSQTRAVPPTAQISAVPSRVTPSPSVLERYGRLFGLAAIFAPWVLIALVVHFA